MNGHVSTDGEQSETSRESLRLWPAETQWGDVFPGNGVDEIDGHFEPSADVTGIERAKVGGQTNARRESRNE